MSRSPKLRTAVHRVSKIALRTLLGSRLPRYDGELSVEGLTGKVRIRRDRWAIPHIQAEHDQDVWFGLGFCQGQDRAFQLELFLRVCRGTLAEMIGNSMLPLDRLSRRIGFRRDCTEQLRACSQEVQGVLQAFALGANAGALRGVGAQPHELALLRVKRSSWQAEDVVAMVRFVAFINSMSWDTQLSRLRILTQDGPAALSALELGTAENDPCSIPPGAPFGRTVDRLSEELAAFERWVGKGGASNNWVIGQNRTRSGRTLVANDPHLDPSVPSQFYLAHLSSPGVRIAGAAFVGAPAIAAGHNGVGAWGMTNGKADAARLFIEELGPDGKSVREGGTWQPCRVEEEVIHVRWGRDVTERVTITPRGPIISPAVEEERHALSFAATWLRPAPVRGFLTAHRATSFETFRREFAEWPCAPLNLVYGDVHGTVGWQLIGELPAERADYGYLPGRPTDTSFSALLPFDKLPHFAGGPDDVVGTANNPAYTDTTDPLLGLHWTAGYRARRIYEALGQRRDWDPAQCLGLQMDLISIPWRELREVVLAMKTEDPVCLQALAILAEWHGRLEASSAGAAVFELFLYHMGRRILEVKAPHSADLALGGGIHPSPRQFTNFAMQRFSHTSRLLREQPNDWFADGWAIEMNSALRSAMDVLRRHLGRDPRRWSWGALRPVTFKHPLGLVEPLASIFNLGPFSWGGDATTLSMCTSHPVHPLQNPVVLATLRMVVDVGNWDDARFVLQSGQSGNPLSPHYADMWPLWLRGETVRMAWEPEAVARDSVHELNLSPGKA